MLCVRCLREVKNNCPCGTHSIDKEWCKCNRPTQEGKMKRLRRKTKIDYVCGFEKCKKVHTTEQGFWARLECQHEDSSGLMLNWYPVKIIKIREVFE